MLTGEKGRECVAALQTLIPILLASSRANYAMKWKQKLVFRTIRRKKCVTCVAEECFSQLCDFLLKLLSQQFQFKSNISWVFFLNRSKNFNFFFNKFFFCCFPSLISPTLREIHFHASIPITYALVVQQVKETESISNSVSFAEVSIYRPLHCILPTGNGLHKSFVR